MAEVHARNCSGQLSVSSTVYRGHVFSLKIRCDRKAKPHVFNWSSSPYLKNGEFLVNHRVAHAFFCSGMLPVHYTRLCSESRIGCIDKKVRNSMSKRHAVIIGNECMASIENAILEETAMYEDLEETVDMEGEDGAIVTLNRHPGIDIMTDARHGWRKNAKDSSVVAVGEKTHKVLQCIHVTKKDDPVTQRHETFGTKKIYDNLLQYSDINIHVHDRNLSVNNVCKEYGFQNQNDTWHAVKSLKSSLKTICTGPKYKHGKTWHEQLYDKLEPVATHVHWAIRNCQGDADTLRSSLDNIVSHYKNIHTNCSPESRCRKDPNYEPSRLVITNPVAQKLLKDTIEHSVVYKKAEDYQFARDTYYVESFNNTLNIFQDKRICFSDMEYKKRADLAVLHWNENVNRGYTSIWTPSSSHATGRKLRRKTLKKLTYKYRQNIWNAYLNVINQ